MKNIKIFFLTLYFLFFFNEAYSKGAGPGAIEAYNTIIKQSKQKSTNFSKGKLHIKKAIKYEKKNKDKKAEEFYGKAINYFYAHNKEFVPTLDTYFFLGLAYGKIKKFDEAIIYFSLGAELDPNHTLINEYLGSLYFSVKNLNLAKENLKKLDNCNCKEFINLKNILDGKEKSHFSF